MKKLYLLAFSLLILTSVQAQWTDSGTNLTTTDNVGIGNSNPDKTLSIDGEIGFFRNGTHPTNVSVGFIKYENGLTVGNSSLADPLIFQTNSTNRLYIHNNGNIGIGNSNPDKTLSIDGEIGFFRNGTHPTNVSVGFIKYENGLTVGNSSLADPLIFQTNSTNRLYIHNNGNIGIGNSNPDKTLSIDGEIGFFRNGTHPTNVSVGFIKYENGLTVGNSSLADPLIFQTNSTNRLYIHNNGNIGIGTTMPDSKLTVAGKIHSQEVKVTVNAGADFVFEDSFELRSLEETEEFISKNNHLPEIATANEMIKNGLELGEMNIKLLQKIEELTLYMIEQNKQNQVQQVRIEQLEKELKIMKNE